MTRRKAASGKGYYMEVLYDDVENVQLLILKKVNDFLNYVYPITLGMSKVHAVIRDDFIQTSLNLVDSLIVGGKTGQVSKLYQADSYLTKLKFLLRFMTDSRRKLFSQKQQEISEKYLVEIGRILGSWIKKKGK